MGVLQRRVAGLRPGLDGAAPGAGDVPEVGRGPHEPQPVITSYSIHYTKLYESFKPDAKVYRFVAERLNRPIGELRLVATHDWDTHGALTAGMLASYNFV